MLFLVVYLALLLQGVRSSMQASQPESLVELISAIHHPIAPQLFNNRSNAPMQEIFSHLRREPSLDLLNTRWSEGWFEIISYVDDECRKPAGKELFTLNTCMPYWNTGNYITLFLAPVDLKTLRVVYLLYSDSSCQNQISPSAVQTFYPSNRCKDRILYHYRSKELGLIDPGKDNTAMFIGVYDTAQHCQANNYLNGILTAFYIAKNSCFNIYSTSDFFNGCDATGRLLGAVYDSANGQCVGSPVSSIAVKPSSTCDQQQDALSNVGILGNVNFQCFR